MKELCPDAWLVNFTNPSGMVTESVIRYGKWDKVIGLCNVPVGAMMKEPEMIGKTLDQLVYKFAGLNQKALRLMQGQAAERCHLCCGDSGAET